MKGIITRSLTGAAALGGLAAGGCHGEGKCIDNCYPERYVHMARQEVVAAFAPQVQNGEILSQTVWNYCFEPGRDELTTGGRDYLDGLARRRPSPNPRVYLATARDISYDPANPDRYTEVRRDLDDRRATAVQKYLTAQTAGRPMAFEIVVHDPAQPEQHAHTVNRSVLLNQNVATGSAMQASSAPTAGQGNSGSSGGSGGGGSSGNSGGNSGGSR